MTAERAYVLGSEELYEESPGPEIPADIARRPAWERARVALADLHPPEPAELAVPVEDLGPDLGGDYYARRDPQRQTRRLVAQLQRLGHTVTLQEAA